MDKDRQRDGESLAYLVQWCVSQLVLNIHPDALSEQELDHVELPEVRRHVERGVARLGLAVAVRAVLNLKGKYK